MVDQLEMPFFLVGGNADLVESALEDGAEPDLRRKRHWVERFGRTYYSFRYHDVLFVVLDTDDPPGTSKGSIGPEQEEWLGNTLADAEDARWTLVFLHRPLWIDDPDRWAEIETRLVDRPATVFAGHHHRYSKDVFGGRVHYRLATTGGSSRLEGPGEGRFDHVAWVTMTEDGPRICNLLLDGIWSDDPLSDAREEAE